MTRFSKLIDIPIIGVLLLWGSLFLFKMAYIKLWYSTPICIAWLGAIYFYLKMRFDIKIPLVLLVLVYLSVALDGVGNICGFYTTRYEYIQYDQFTHAAIPTMTTPVIVWLLHIVMTRMGHPLPLAMSVFFAITVMFTIAGFYEVLEYLDDRYMWPQPGMRIHGAYDTPFDLLCDLVGMTVGGLFALLTLRFSTPLDIKVRNKRTTQSFNNA